MELGSGRSSSSTTIPIEHRLRRDDRVPGTDPRAYHESGDIIGIFVFEQQVAIHRWGNEVLSGGVEQDSSA